MKDARIRAFRVRVFEVPLKRPFITALGRKSSTVNAAIELELSDGARGYGEASSSLALAHLTPKKLAAALKTLGRRAVGSEISRLEALSARAWASHGRIAPAAAAFECALFEAAASRRGLSLSDWFGGRLARLESDVTISASDAVLVSEAVAAAKREGFKQLKVKVGETPAADWLRIAAAHQAHPAARLILDGNQGQTVSGALKLVEKCLKAGIKIDLLEQPVPKGELKKLAAVARGCPVPVAADESCSSPEDAARLADMDAVQVINIKVAKSGLLRSFQIASIARAAGIKLMIGCMAETARGLSPSVHLALGAGFFEFHDLDSDHLLAGGPAGLGWSRRGPMIRRDF